MASLARVRSQRLRTHRLVAPAVSVTDGASHMLAVQSQEFWAGRYALSVRTASAPSIHQMDRRFDRGDLVRSWTMRGTLHITPASDLRWVLSVTAERMRQGSRARHRELGIDGDALSRAREAITAALSGRNQLTRAEAFAVLASVGIDPTGQRGAHLLTALAVEATVCWGPVVTADDRPTREQRLVLVDEWIGESAYPEDPLAELLVRYLDGHGPATLRDFAWWSGLTLGMAREARERAATRVSEADAAEMLVTVIPRARSAERGVHALGPFDEFYISYADRTTVASEEASALIGPGRNGMVRSTIISGGAVAGTWTVSPADAMRGVLPRAEVFASVDPDALAAALRRVTEFFHS